MTPPPAGTRERVLALARVGLWLLPVHAVLLALGTLTHQPDPGTAFDDYARYVTTGTFLVSHLVASILGAALGAVGMVAALAFLVRGPAWRAAAAGVALSIAGEVVTSAVIGAAAFAQPAVGRAHLSGSRDAAAIDADVYGPVLFATAGVGLLLLMAGAVAFGVAVARTAPRLRAAGTGYAVCVPLFAVTGIFFSVVQPVAAAALAVAAGVIAARLPTA